MDDNYIVRTHREGTIKTTTSIEDALTSMGQTALTNRSLGSVVAIVEKANGKITKSNWGYIIFPVPTYSFSHNV